MKHGMRPIVKDWRDKSFHKTFQRLFGATGFPAAMPAEFDFDAGLTMPDQNAPDAFFGIPALPYGCTGETQADICVDEDLVRYDPKFVYDNTRMMEGTYGQDVGCDIRDSLKSLSIYGVRALGQTDAQVAEQRRGIYMNALANKGSLDYFDAMRVAMWRQYELTGVKRTLSVGTPWMNEWSSAYVGSIGLVPGTFVYSGNASEYQWHNWKIAGFVMVKGLLRAKAKTWQGNSYGDKGFSYYDRDTINKIFAIQYTGAYLPGVKLDPKDAASTGNVVQVILQQVIIFLRRQLALLRPQS